MLKIVGPVVFFTTGAAAVGVLGRDVTQVTNVMTPVLQGIGSLDSVIQQYDGEDHGNFRGEADKMLQTLSTAIESAKTITPLSLDEAYEFKPLSDELNAAGDRLIHDLKGKQPVFAEAHICKHVLEWTTKLGTNVNTLMNTVASKFPAEGQSSDAEIIEHFQKAFADAENKLKPCAGEAGGSEETGRNTTLTHTTPVPYSAAATTTVSITAVVAALAGLLV